VALPIYVISLSPEHPRVVALVESLNHYRFSFEIIKAIDGRKLDLDQCPIYDGPASRAYMGRELVGGEIGCYLSHLNAAKALLKSSSEAAIVLEDDAMVTSDLIALCSQIASKLSSVDPDWLLVNIGKSSDKITSGIETLSPTDHVLKAAHYFPVTTHGLLWSRRGAQAFVDQHARIWAPVDNYLRHWLTREAHGYCVHPPIVGLSGAESLIAPSSKSANRNHNGRTWGYEILKQKRLFIDKLIALRMKLGFSRAQRARGA
jgi:glycosyl transferase family 25